jgi:hypothetical protein
MEYNTGRDIRSERPDAPGQFDVILYEWRKNARERVRVSLSHYRGHDLVDIRAWFDAGDGTFRPSKSGIGIQWEQLPQLRRALEAAEAAVRNDPDPEP